MKAIEAPGSLEKIFWPLRNANLQGTEKQYANFCKQHFFGQAFWNAMKEQEGTIHLHYSQRNKIA